MFAHCNVAEPKLYVESKEGTIFLDSVLVALRLPVRFPVTLPVKDPPDTRVTASA